MLKVWAGVEIRRMYVPVFRFFTEMEPSGFRAGWEVCRIWPLRETISQAVMSSMAGVKCRVEPLSVRRTEGLTWGGMELAEQVAKR